jgi:hypothetical protein
MEEVVVRPIHLRREAAVVQVATADREAPVLPVEVAVVIHAVGEDNSI